MASAPARIFPLNVVHAIRGTVTYATSGITAGKEIGTLPANCHVLRTSVHVITAFNAATTNTLDIGTAATAGAFAPNTVTLVGTAGYKSGLTGTGNGNTLTADTPVVVKYAQTGAAATAGTADIVVEFYPQGS